MWRRSRRPPPAMGDLLDWLRSWGDLDAVGVEGTGSYGAGLARHLAAAATATVCGPPRRFSRPQRATERRIGGGFRPQALAGRPGPPGPLSGAASSPALPSDRPDLGHFGGIGAETSLRDARRAILRSGVGGLGTADLSPALRASWRPLRAPWRPKTPHPADPGHVRRIRYRMAVSTALRATASTSHGTGRRAHPADGGRRGPQQRRQVDAGRRVRRRRAQGNDPAGGLRRRRGGALRQRLVTSVDAAHAHNSSTPERTAAHASACTVRSLRPRPVRRRSRSSPAAQRQAATTVSWAWPHEPRESPKATQRTIMAPPPGRLRRRGGG